MRGGVIDRSDAAASSQLHCSASSDGLLYWISEEYWSRGLVRLAGLLDDLLIERQAEQPETQLDTEPACSAWPRA